MRQIEPAVLTMGVQMFPRCARPVLVGLIVLNIVQTFVLKLVPSPLRIVLCAPTWVSFQCCPRVPLVPNTLRVGCLVLARRDSLIYGPACCGRPVPFTFFMLVSQGVAPLFVG